MAIESSHHLDPFLVLCSHASALENKEKDSVVLMLHAH